MTASHDFEINLVQKVSVGFVEALYSPCYRLVKSGDRISINKKTREQFGEWIEMETKNVVESNDVLSKIVECFKTNKFPQTNINQGDEYGKDSMLRIKAGEFEWSNSMDTMSRREYEGSIDMEIREEFGDIVQSITDFVDEQLKIRSFSVKQISETYPFSAEFGSEFLGINE